MLEEWRSNSEEETIEVNEDDIMAVVAKWTGVPLQRMEEAEAEDADANDSDGDGNSS